MRRARGHRFPQHVPGRQLRNAKTCRTSSPEYPFPHLAVPAEPVSSAISSSHQFLAAPLHRRRLPSVTLDPSDYPHPNFPTPLRCSKKCRSCSPVSEPCEDKLIHVKLSCPFFHYGSSVIEGARLWRCKIVSFVSACEPRAREEEIESH